MYKICFITLLTCFAWQNPAKAQSYRYAEESRIEDRRGAPSNVYYQRQPSDDLRSNAYNQPLFQSNRNGEGSSFQTTNRAGSTVIDNISEKNFERTLSILKPDAVRNRHIGDIISRFEGNGLRVVAIKMLKLNSDQASKFYSVHRDRPFFKDLVQFISSGPVIVMVLEGEQAVSKNRQLMGATDPNKAEQGTIRADYAESISQNAVHGSDSLEAANQEIPFFFRSNEIYLIR